jgi:hypothetical protein
MKRTFAAGLLVTATASIVSSAFASGYGPAPFYRPDVGSTVWRHGHYAQALPTEGPANGTRDVTGEGSSMPQSESGARASPPVELPSAPQQ